MIPKACKRLAEVDFPIAEVSRHAAREKSIRHGHPSTLHLWWARRPLASSRAVLLALLWPDPCDPLCPEGFKANARQVLSPIPGCHPGATDPDLRRALLRFIADFANWDRAADRSYLEAARSLVKAAYPEEAPLVVDPFAGGGSIPLEALRVGCEAFASDLNPVACLILKVMLEDIPRHGPQLADELRRVGAEVKHQAEKELAEFYPKDPDGATPIAYLWARTVQCEAPNCGAEIPLLRSLWLCRKLKRKRALKCRVNRTDGHPPQIDFEVFTPKSDKDVPTGTVANARATCPACGAVLPPERVRAQLAAARGGADVVFDDEGRRTAGARLFAVVTLRSGEQGRCYRLPADRDYHAVWKAQQRLTMILDEWERSGRQGLRPVPDEPLNPVRPSPNARGLSAVTRYGVVDFGMVFTARQKLALSALSSQVRDRAGQKTHAASRAAAMLVGRSADYGSSAVVWSQTGEFVAHTFGRHALPMVWDFAEAVPWSGSSGNFDGAIDWVARVIAAWPGSGCGQVQLVDASEHPLPDDTSDIWFTDPPYYDQIPYADLSDFFLVWLKRTLPSEPLLGDPFDRANQLSPKERECVWNQAYKWRGRQKNKAFFEERIAQAMAEGRRTLRSDGVASVVFAHGTTEGWEAFLGGLITGGLTVTASWPIATERASRVRARENASLATSIHLVCRPRPDDAPVGDWGDVLRELPQRVGDWMERLQSEGVRGADLVFACIGPALEIFSRYSGVETADGHEVALADYLEKVWEVVGRQALEQVLGTAEAKARNGAAGALEEDSRLTGLFLWTLQSTNGGQAAAPAESTDAEEDEEPGEDDQDEGTASARKPKGYTLVFDVVRRFAQPLGIDLPKWEGRVIETKKGVVRLLPIGERARILFGQEGAKAVAARLERPAAPAHVQGTLFSDLEVTGTAGTYPAPAKPADLSAEALEGRYETTTLDRVHAAMLLQAGGQTNALRNLLSAEQERGSDFLRLANALSALYPRGSEEKRLLDAMLLAVPR